MHKYPARLASRHPFAARRVTRSKNVVVQRDVEASWHVVGRRIIVRLPVDVTSEVIACGVVVPTCYANDVSFVAASMIALDYLHIPHRGVTEEAGALLCEVESEAGGGFFLRRNGAAERGWGSDEVVAWRAVKSVGDKGVEVREMEGL